ncbi:hypothetical protein [Salipiger mangrovisoli]|uniref:DUF2059 domain-containing protein n=1 Tax=Salipiger mangrovisoli TaxID=2865933 RepID=A0ABR9WYM7_9RHOB|nr:hypothetical protein [Salipiger mangrovisoli]MBE9636378.1 hypothetical protein [Salipiger mangrovisoli]
MKFFLAISSVSFALAATSPAVADEDLLNQLSRYVPESVLSLLSESQILTAFSLSTSRDSNAQKASRIEYIATSGSAPRTYSSQQLDLVREYVSDDELSRMSGQHIGSAMAIAHSSRPEVEKRGLIRALSAR